MKCNKCGAEVPEGMKFCGACGTPVPQTIKCASCGADIEAGMKFCGICGAPVNQKKKCVSCGAEISYNLNFCPMCGANQNQPANNGAPVNSAPVTPAANPAANPSEAPVKQEEPITMVETLELKNAREKFFGCDGNLSEILKTAESLWKAHSSNEDILSLYLGSLAASGKEMEALKIIEGLGEGNLSACIAAIDILLTKQELTEVEKKLNKAKALFPDSNVLKCYEAYYNLMLYKKYNELSFLENAANANASLKDVNGPLELSHQLRVMSLLQIESGEEPPTYYKDFCKENNIYFRIVSNTKLGGVFVEGVASAESAPRIADVDAWDEEVYANNAPENTGCDETDNYLYLEEEEIEKFIKLYGEGDGMFSLSRIEPDWREWGTGDDQDAYDDGSGEITLRDVLTGEVPFATHGVPILVYRKMAKDGLNFRIHWDSTNMAGIGIGDGEAKDGYFWHCIDYDATESECEERGEDFDPYNFDCYIEHIDKYGNRCELDTSKIIVQGTKATKGYIVALPMKAILNDGGKWDDCVYEGTIWKVPTFFRSHYEAEDLEYEDYSYFLRCTGLNCAPYLLDKNGKRITALRDFVKTEPDKDGNIYYPVPTSDFEDGDSGMVLTPKATAKWKAKLGM